jgi:hypothetical protein
MATDDSNGSGKARINHVPSPTENNSGIIFYNTVNLFEDLDRSAIQYLREIGYRPEDIETMPTARQFIHIVSQTPQLGIEARLSIPKVGIQDAGSNQDLGLSGVYIAGRGIESPDDAWEITDEILTIIKRLEKWPYPYLSPQPVPAYIN